MRRPGVVVRDSADSSFLARLANMGLCFVTMIVMITWVVGIFYSFRHEAWRLTGEKVPAVASRTVFPQAAKQLKAVNLNSAEIYLYRYLEKEDY